MRHLMALQLQLTVTVCHIVHLNCIMQGLQLHKCPPTHHEEVSLLCICMPLYHTVGRTKLLCIPSLPVFSDCVVHHCHSVTECQVGNINSISRTVLLAAELPLLQVSSPSTHFNIRSNVRHGNQHLSNDCVASHTR